MKQQKGFSAGRVAGGTLGCLGLGVVIMIVLAVGSAANQTSAGGSADNGFTSAPVDTKPTVVIESSNWYKDPDFAGRGAVVWTAVVRNKSSGYVESVPVEITTFDKNGHIVDTDFSYASGLAPGGTGSVKGYATYFGTEKTASFRIK